MIDTVALLISEVYGSLGNPDQAYLDSEDVARAVFHSLAYGQQSVLQSSQNQRLSHVSIFPQARDWPLDAAPDLSQPLWLERALGSGSSQTWLYIPTVNLASIESSYLRGEQKVAFYAENGTHYLRLSYNPLLISGAAHRLWYDPSPPLPQTAQDTPLNIATTGLPEGFFPYFTAKAGLRLIPLMMSRCAEQEGPRELMEAWKLLALSLQGTVTDWQPLFRMEIYGDKGRQRGRKRRPILFRDPYL